MNGKYKRNGQTETVTIVTIAALHVMVVGYNNQNLVVLKEVVAGKIQVQIIMVMYLVMMMMIY